MRKSNSTPGALPEDTPSPIPSPIPNPIEDLRERIETFLLGLRRPVVTEPGREVIDLSASNYSLSTEYNKLLWHIWNERTNVVRQITGIHKESAGRMELRFQKFGKGPPGTLLVGESRAAAEQLERRSERLRYSQKFRRYLSQMFPQWKAENIGAEPDLKRSFSGLYTRGVLCRGQQAWAVIGAGEEEDAQTIDGILTYGVIWLDWLRQSDTRRVYQGLKIFVPAKRGTTTLQRLAWMDSQLAQWELYETGEEVRRCDAADVGNLKIMLAPAGGTFTLRPSAASRIERIIERVIERIVEISPQIETHLGPGGLRVFAVHGLPFAKETAQGVIFGVGRAETLVDEKNFGQLKKLVTSILRFRGAQTKDSQSRQHPYYRLQAEKWMQSMVIRQIGVLGYKLASDALYEQVPAASGAEAGWMDLLAVDSNGRLAVVEFKASEDIPLPLQAFDYWIRVHRHQQRGELQRQGYFSGRALSGQPPLLLLVSPALQFHSACETVLRYFSPTVEAVRIGLNEQWREGLQVVFRMGR